MREDESALCAEGYTGSFCDECTEGLVQQEGYKCGTCNNGVASLMLLLFLVSFVGYVIYSIRVENQSDDYPMVGTFFKILSTTFLVNSIALSFSFDWEDSVITALGIQSE